MKKAEIRRILETILKPEARGVDPPTEQSWQALQEKFGTRFPSEFRSFLDLLAEFSFPGDVYNVTGEGRTNGNDTIEAVYENEVAFSAWPKELIPFYGIGNGDYFALNSSEGELSAVYYRCHEDGRVEKYSASFEEWLRHLPIFLDGGISETTLGDGGGIGD